MDSALRTNRSNPAPPPEPATQLSKPVAVGIAVLAMLVAVAAGHLVAGFIAVNASPFVAVADGVVSLTGGGLKQWAVDNLGTSDKTVLLIGEAVLLLAVAIGAGLASRRRPGPGITVVLALGVVGGVAVWTRVDVGGIGVLAPAASMIAGGGVFAWLHRLARQSKEADEPESNEPKSVDNEPVDNVSVENSETVAAQSNRRTLLLGSAGAAAGAVIAGGVGQLLVAGKDVEQSRAEVGTLTPVRPATIPAGADYAGDGGSTFLTPNADFYRVDTALAIPQLRAQDWSLRIHGMVEHEKTFSYNDIRRRRLVEAPVTLTCVSNDVGGPYISTATWIGVPMHELLAEVGVRPGADQLLSSSSDGFTAGTPVDTLTDPKRGALLAIGMNGQPLPIEHGFPARIVVPGLYGYVSATKWVVDMELTTFAAKQGYWVPRGWAQRGPIKTESRIDVPAAGAKIPAGRVVVLAGLAWAQPKGVAKVEVRVDNGPWQQAQLAADVSDNTWRMWRLPVRLGAGGHTVQARATDKSGYTQTADSEPPEPDGATGYPSSTFLCT